MVTAQISNSYTLKTAMLKIREIIPETLVYIHIMEFLLIIIKTRNFLVFFSPKQNPKMKPPALLKAEIQM